MSSCEVVSEGVKTKKYAYYLGDITFVRLFYWLLVSFLIHKVDQALFTICGQVFLEMLSCCIDLTYSYENLRVVCTIF